MRRVAQRRRGYRAYEAGRRSAVERAPEPRVTQQPAKVRALAASVLRVDEAREGAAIATGPAALACQREHEPGPLRQRMPVDQRAAAWREPGTRRLDRGGPAFFGIRLC